MLVFLLTGLAAAKFVTRGAEARATRTHTADGACDAAALQNCAALLGEAFTADAVAATLGADAADVRGLLATLGVEGASLACAPLCTAATAQPALLGVQTIPTKPGCACLDCGCSECVGVEPDDLARVADELLASHPTDASGNALTPRKVKRDPRPADEGDDHAPEGTKDPEVLRSVLAVVFGLFPPTAQACDAADVQPMTMMLAVDPAAEPVSLVRRDLDPALGSHMTRAHGDKLRKIRKGCQLATAWAASALRNVDTSTGRRLRKVWFGSQGEANPSHLRRVLAGILTVMDNVLVRSGSHGGDPWEPRGDGCEVNGGSGTMAYVYPEQKAYADGGHRYIMYLCDFMLGFRFQSWVGTIVHEASHHFGTDDHVYGRREGKDLAKTAPRKAYNNADNVEYWVTDLVSALGAEPPRSASTPTSRQWRPAEGCTTACGALVFEGALLEGPLALSAGQCARCEWVTRKRFFGPGCGDGVSLGKKTALSKVCCWRKQCA